MQRSPAAGKHMSFQATLENWAEGMDYCADPVPAKITQALGTKRAVLVLARVNESEPFKVSLFPVGAGQHYLRIKAKVRKETKTKTGDRVRVWIIVLDRADVTIPKELMSALSADGVADDFRSLPPGKQNFMIRRIDEAARLETRKKRVQEAVEAAHHRRDLSTMAHERALEDRIRKALTGKRSVREVKMFGGLSFMVNERLVIGVTRDGDLLIRADPEQADELLTVKGARPAEMGNGRVMGKSWISVARKTIGTDQTLDYWIEVALQGNDKQPTTRSRDRHTTR